MRDSQAGADITDVGVLRAWKGGINQGDGVSIREINCQKWSVFLSPDGLLEGQSRNMCESRDYILKTKLKNLVSHSLHFKIRILSHVFI